MHDEALITLPLLLERMKIRDAVLVGHSDGGSIALIHAGGRLSNSTVQGLILEAPHVFVEDITEASIKRLVESYQGGELRSGLDRYHGKQVDEMFWGWSNVWLDQEFRSWNIEEFLPHIDVPILLLQGRNDEYGTLEQVSAIEKGCGQLVETVLLEECGHDPHFDQPERTLEECVKFLRKLKF
jgi:pimeloyl-ACP methyl ester carboxylesterase